MKTIFSFILLLSSLSAFAESRVICKTRGNNTPELSTAEATNAINREIRKFKNPDPNFISAPSVTSVKSEGSGRGLYNTTLCVTVVTPESK